MMLGDWERRARLMHDAHLLVMRLMETAIWPAAA
jgi:hypothetical protein